MEMEKVKRKRKQIDIKLKKSIIDSYDRRKVVESKPNVTLLASEFQLPESTVRRILKQRDTTMELYNQGKVMGDRKRNRLSPFEDINACILEWFRQMTAQNFPIDGRMMQEKALEFASKLGVEGFHASNG